MLATINVLAKTLNSNPATATLCASSLSPINLGVVGRVPGLLNAVVTCISATVESDNITVYPRFALPPCILAVFGEIVSLDPGPCNTIEELPTVTIGKFVVCLGSDTNLYFNA